MGLFHVNSKHSDQTKLMTRLIGVFSRHITTFIGFLMLQVIWWERSGSVVECSSRDHWAVGSSLTGVTVLCL